jgi:hypothetical protein
MGEMSRLGWLIGWSSCIGADSLYFLYVVLGSNCKTFTSFQLLDVIYIAETLRVTMWFGFNCHSISTTGEVLCTGMNLFRFHERLGNCLTRFHRFPRRNLRLGVVKWVQHEEHSGFGLKHYPKQILDNNILLTCVCIRSPYTWSRWQLAPSLHTCVLRGTYVSCAYIT